MPPEISSLRKAGLWIAATGGLVLAAVAVFFARPRPEHPTGPSAQRFAGPAEVLRTNLVLIDGRLHRAGQAEAFTGSMVERYANGTLRSRSAISNGVLHGLSEGWYTNGQLQVTEYFREGLSHGVRNKWRLNGAKLSEATIVEGKLHGPFRRWHENGVLSEQVEFVADRPEGTSLAYFPSGSLRARVLLQNGKPTEQTFWQDGESDDSSGAGGLNE